MNVFENGKKRKDINETKIQFFKKTSKIDKPPANVKKKKTKRRKKSKDFFHLL